MVCLRKMSILIPTGLALLAGDITLAQTPPLVIGHRGASGYRPEHTLAAYELAIQQGADFIEPDLVATKDGVLVARHENEIDGTTDVTDRPEFAARFTTKVIDGTSISGWFTEDFTLAELKILRAKERIPGTRPGNTTYNGLFEVPTLEEVIDLAAAHNVGIYLETKHPTFFASQGISLSQKLVDTLVAKGFTDPNKVFIQSFEVGNLQELHNAIMPAAGVDLSLVQLVTGGAPYDFIASGDSRTYADLTTPAGLDFINDYADGLGVNKTLMIPRDGANNLGSPTSLLDDAHAAGLIVHGWTFRAENTFLPTDMRSSGDPNALGDMEAELHAYFIAGMDGFFTDQPDLGRAAANSFVPEPASGAVLALGGLAALRRRNRG